MTSLKTLDVKILDLKEDAENVTLLMEVIALIF
jgi:hypothetical protein